MRLRLLAGGPRRQPATARPIDLASLPRARLGGRPPPDGVQQRQPVVMAAARLARGGPVPRSRHGRRRPGRRLGGGRGKDDFAMALAGAKPFLRAAPAWPVSRAGSPPTLLRVRPPHKHQTVHDPGDLEHGEDPDPEVTQADGGQLGVLDGQRRRQILAVLPQAVVALPPAGRPLKVMVDKCLTRLWPLLCERIGACARLSRDIPAHYQTAGEGRGLDLAREVPRGGVGPRC